jgi:predicted RNA binding protein YcfA (HicA-like mRNA interferase family)
LRLRLGRLRIFSGSEVCRLLERHGFVEARRKGSHIIMQKRSAASTITVPVPNHSELRIGTLQSIIRQSGLNRDLFESE